MQIRKLLPALVLLLMGMWLAAPSHAAEMVGPSTPQASSSCPADAAVFSLPSPLISTDVTPATAPIEFCGCGDDLCVGKEVNSRCGPAGIVPIRFCFSTGVCTPAGTARRCGCLPPP
jgi:hypothetical protein